MGKAGVDLIDLSAALDFEDVAEDESAGFADAGVEGDDGVHAEERLLEVVDVVAVRGGGDDVGDAGVLFGQVGFEVHLFPPKLLFGLHSWEAELRPQSDSLHEIQGPV